MKVVGPNRSQRCSDPEKGRGRLAGISVKSTWNRQEYDSYGDREIKDVLEDRRRAGKFTASTSRSRNGRRAWKPKIKGGSIETGHKRAWGCPLGLDTDFKNGKTIGKEMRTGMVHGLSFSGLITEVGGAT